MNISLAHIKEALRRCRYIFDLDKIFNLDAADLKKRIPAIKNAVRRLL